MSESRVEAVEKALSVLEAFSQNAQALTLTELSRETGLHKSNVLRLAASLERFGYLKRGRDLKYRLGPALWRLGTLYRRNFDMSHVIRPAIRNLADFTGETASFYVLDQDERLCLYRENSRNPLRHHLDEGSRLTLKLGASANILSAFGLGIKEARDKLHKNGASVSVAERNPNLAAIAMPLFDRQNQFLGAVSVSGPLERFDFDARTKALEYVSQITRELTVNL